MKNLFVLILLFLTSCRVVAGKPSSRLFVPSFPISIKPFEDHIFLPAYNVDLVRPWPADLHPMEHIIAGNETSKLTLKVKGKLVTLSVQQALTRKLITLYSITKAVNGRNEGLIMEALPDIQVKLVALVDKGLVAADSAETGNNLSLPLLNKDVSHDYSLNCMYTTTWSDNQQKVWQAMYVESAGRPNALDSLQRGIFDNIIAGSHNLPPYYVIGYQKSMITIQAKKSGFNLEKPEANYYNDGGMPFMMLDEIIGQLKVLVSEDPQPGAQGKMFFGEDGSSVDSIVIYGKYRGIVPVKIRYSTDQKVGLMARFDESQNLLASGEAYVVKLFLVYDTSLKRGECRIPLPKTMEFPAGKNAPTLKACGIIIQPEENGLGIGL